MYAALGYIVSEFYDVT